MKRTSNCIMIQIMRLVLQFSSSTILDNTNSRNSAWITRDSTSNLVTRSHESLVLQERDPELAQIMLLEWLAGPATCTTCQCRVSFVHRLAIPISLSLLYLEGSPSFILRPIRLKFFGNARKLDISCAFDFGINWRTAGTTFADCKARGLLKHPHFELYLQQIKHYTLQAHVVDLEKKGWWDSWRSPLLISKVNF